LEVWKSTQKVLPFKIQLAIRATQLGSPPSRERLLSSLMACVVAACASTSGDDFAATRASWRGATYDQVVMAWGTPSQSGVDSHTWLSDDNIRYSGAGVGGVMFAAARCDRTLAFRDGRVVDERWSGDPGFCKQYARK
jgi:hypothetical protein